MKIHMVKKGDTLYQIAQKYNVDLDALIALNPQIPDPNVIDVGMKVKIPSAPKPVEPPSDYLYKHIVMQGDTLWKLGKAWNVPLNDMIEANPQLKNPSVLMTGETVYIPKTKSQTGQQGSHHHYHGGQGHKKNTAPIQTEPVAPMPVEPLPQVNVPNAEAGPTAEMPFIPFPNIPNIPNIPNMPNMPNMEMPQHTAPNMELPYHHTPNMEMPQHTLPNMEMPQYTLPNMEMPQHTSPNMELPYHHAPNMEMPYHQMPNMPAPYSPFTMEQPMAESNPNQPMYVSPFSQQAPDQMPEVPANLPNFTAQGPASDLFKPFHVPATEVMSSQPNDVSPAAWQAPDLPAFPNMPSAGQMPFGGFPAQPYPDFTHPLYEKDCGCGGPGPHSQPIPYPLTPHAEMPALTHAPQGYQPMYPGHGFPGMMPSAELSPFHHGFDPTAMTSAFPGGMYPNPGYPAHPYAGFPYPGQHEYVWGDKSRGDEEELRTSSGQVSSVSSGAAESVQAAPSKKRTRTQGSGRSSAPKTSGRTSAKPKSKRSPWINV